jgi:hypothetical protein
MKSICLEHQIQQHKHKGGDEVEEENEVTINTICDRIATLLASERLS